MNETTQMYIDQCNDNCIGSLGINYIEILQHDELSVILLILWTLTLVDLLSNSASMYFTPTLESICDKMNLPQNIAGVTFLALGNGAPDFFTLFSSFSRNKDEKLPLDASVGAALFICTVVVGAIAVVSPCNVRKGIFLRDILFLLITTTLLTIVSVVDYVTFYLSIGLVLCYIVYIVFVWIHPVPDAVIGSSHHGHGNSDIPNSEIPPKEENEKLINNNHQVNNLEYGAIEDQLVEEPIVRAYRCISYNCFSHWFSSCYRHYHDESLLPAISYNLCCGNDFLAFIFFIIELPVMFFRDLTVPTLQKERWMKIFAIFHPFAIALAFVLTTGLNTWFNIIVSLIIASPFSLFLMFYTDHNGPPRGLTFEIIWDLVAFCMGVWWIFIICGELVACLYTIGVISGLPDDDLLGILVLAWANSLGDLFTDTDIARQGNGEMALGGCYGGPIFNILIGLGVSLTYNYLLFGNGDQHIQTANSFFLSLGFLVFALLSTLVIVVWKGFRLDRSLGIFLIVLYLVHLVLQISYEVFWVFT